MAHTKITTRNITDDAVTSAKLDNNITITTADNSSQLILSSTDTDSSSGPVLELFRNSSSPADNDATGLIYFYGENDNDEKIAYAAIDSRIVDASDGTEDGRIEVATILAGTAGVSRILMDATETVINDNSKDLDFRVESDGNANMLFVDGGNDSVGIGTASPAKPLHIYSADNQPLRVESTDAYSGIEIKDNGSSTLPPLISALSDDLLIYTGHGTTRVNVAKFDNDGKTYLKEVAALDASLEVGNGDEKLIFDGSGQTMQFQTSDGERMRINSDGYVSLNRNASEYGLELKSAGTRSGLVLKKPGTDTIQGSLLMLASDETMRLGTASVYNIQMNQSGHNTMPNQPYIRCAGNAASMAANQGTTADYSNWADQVQRGITRSGAVFTVPTAGEYLITYSFYNWMNNTGQGVTHAIYLYKGSSAVQEITAEYDMGDNNYSYYDNNLGGSLILNMAAGDTFKFVAYADIYGGSTHTNMSAYLLG